MLRWIDRSQAIGGAVQSLSDFLARRRGLLVVMGIILVLASFALQVLNVYTTQRTIELMGVVLHNVGVLVALIGLLLINPLGKV